MTTVSQKFRWMENGSHAAGYVVAYVLLDWLSFGQPVLKLGITPWNPQAGLTLAFLLRFGPRGAVLTACAVLLAEIIVRSMPAPLPVLAAASLVIGAGYGVAALLLERYGATLAESPAGVVRLLLVSVVITLLVASGYVVLFVASGQLPGEAYLPGVARYWVGDVNGILTLTPLLLAAGKWREGVRALARRRGEVVAQASMVLAVLWVMFGPHADDDLRFFYPFFVPVIWIAFRWGVIGAAFATLAIQVALMLVIQDEGGYSPLVDLQFLMVTLAATGLLIGSVVREREDALRRVAAREAEQRAILATAPDAVVSTDAGGCIVSANPAAEYMFAFPLQGMSGRNLHDLVPGILIHGEVGRSSLEAVRTTGEVFPVDVAWARFEAPAADGFILIIRDATGRLASEARLRERDIALARTQRFAVVGEFASALAHELNQPITALVSYLRAAQILAEPLADRDERLTTTLGKAAREAIRASDALRRLRDFYRGGAPVPVAVDCAAALHGVLHPYEERMRQMGVGLDMRMDAGLPTLWCDPTQLEMVLHNLIGNALDALDGVPRAERSLRVSASPVPDSIMLTVEDSGPGVPEAIRPRLFEPFVTTKPDGMGLGLSISRSLLRSQGGDMVARSSELGGAAFILRIPLTISAQVAL